jgi:sec-independent protein translocase protein TatA
VAGLGAPELIIILLIIMLIFGGAKLPKLARSLGESSKEFKKGRRRPSRSPRPRALTPAAEFVRRVGVG